MYFESHCHLDHELCDGIRYELADKMQENGIRYAVIPPISYESNKTAREMFPEEKYPWIYFANGLHPKNATNAAKWNKETKAEFEAFLTDRRCVALKTGLDYSKTKLMDAQKDRQKWFFNMFIDLAEKYNKPIVLHIREAAEDAISFLESHPPKTETVVHCYNYDSDIMNRMKAVGVTYFGIGGMITRPEHEEFRKAVKEMPLEWMLLETDSPFVKLDGDESEINTPLSLPSIAGYIAEIKGMAVEDVVKQTYENACRFYKIM